MRSCVLGFCTFASFFQYSDKRMDLYRLGSLLSCFSHENFRETTKNKPMEKMPDRIPDFFFLSGLSISASPKFIFFGKVLLPERFSKVKGQRSRFSHFSHDHNINILAIVDRYIQPIAVF